MKAMIQNRVAPPSLIQNNPMMDVKVKESGQAIDSNAEPEIDFGKLLQNSNADVQRDREAKIKGDFSSDNQQDFFDKLNEQTRGEFKAPKNKLDKDDFLRLFVEQLKHQDPLNPDDGAELAAKLAQFNSVEQLMGVNRSLTDLATAQSTDRHLMMTNFIGKELSINGGRLRLDQGKISQGEFQLKSPAAQATLQVRDESGRMVFEKPLGPQTAGKHTLPWDGKMHNGMPIANGIYTFNIVANDINGTPMNVDVQSKVKVQGVDVLDKDGLLYTNFGHVKLADIRSIGESGYQKEVETKAEAAAESAATTTTTPTGESPSAGATVADSSLNQTARQVQQPATPTNFRKPAPSLPSS